MQKHHSLLATEHRLVTLFVGGAFIFLLLFEGFFIGSRMLLEGQFQKGDFESQISRMMNRPSLPPERNMSERGNGKPFIGMNTIIVDYSGNILDSRGSIHIEDSEEFIGKEMLSSLPVNTTMEYDGVLMRKILSNSGQDQFTIFFRKSGYPLEDILRDILRFLAMDGLILFPFYFMGRFFVRETLAPVEANMNTMSHFVHDAGHELKTPLAIVSGNLQILRDAKKIEKDLIEESIATIHSMSDSLDGLLELVSLKKSEKSETIEIRKSIEETIEIRKKEVEDKNLNITIDIPKGAKIVMNPHHFSILISNLIGNAIRYNKDNGEISISYKNNLLSIKDTGIGMNEEDVKKIFDRFFRVDHSGKYEGTGIGLSVVDRIIKLYKWEISVKSSPNMGTTFIIHTDRF